jgi:tRNA (Thr-GGU) A37 N-methylase
MEDKIQYKPIGVILDIKPSVPDFDVREIQSIGWLEKNIQKVSIAKDDGRFAK